MMAASADVVANNALKTPRLMEPAVTVTANITMESRRDKEIAASSTVDAEIDRATSFDKAPSTDVVADRETDAARLKLAAVVVAAASISD